MSGTFLLNLIYLLNSQISQFRMVVMSNINGQLTPVLQQNTAQQILNQNDKLKAQQQQQQVILQQVMKIFVN